MSRRSRNTEENFTLFPFLAVLLCTMGTLTMIFAAVAQKGTDAPAAQNAENEENVRVGFDPGVGVGDAAHYGRIVDAETLTEELDRNRIVTDRDREKISALEEIEPEGADEEPNKEQEKQEAPDDAYERALLATDSMTLDDVNSEIESVEWFAEELRSIRSRTDEALESERARLANAEAALARLRETMEVSKRKYEMLAAEDGSLTDKTAVELQDRINALDMQIEKLDQLTQELREKNKNAKKSYAIVPYQGKKGTFRRPIFVECCADGVFIRPEGVKFDEADFLVARYPGNPFDSALRAASRHYLDTLGTKTRNGDLIEPYPLLVVRPGGSKYFYLALAALASWGDRYGYEFVGEDQHLEYPASDPTLKTLLTQQIESSRARLAAQLAEARAIQNAVDRRMAFGVGRSGSADSFYGAFGGPAVPSTELQSMFGSDVRVGAAKVPSGAGSVAGGGASSGAGMISGSGTPGAGGAALASANSSSGLLDGTAGWAPKYQGAFSQFAAAAPSVSDGAPEVQGSSLAKDGGRDFDPAGALAAQNAQNAQSVQNAQNNQFAQNSLLAQNNAGASAASETPSAPTGQETQFVPNTSASSSSAAMPGYMRNMVAGDPNASGESNVDLRKTLGNTAYASGADGSAAQGTLAAQKEKEPPKQDDNMPKEAFRLSQEKPVTSGNERAIIVRCEGDKIVFPKQPGVRRTVSIDCATPEGAASRDKNLLEAIAFCIRSWGAAGRNSYWAPYIKVEVAEGGEERFRELSAFCKEQGLAIAR